MWIGQIIPWLDLTWLDLTNVLLKRNTHTCVKFNSRKNYTTTKKKAVLHCELLRCMFRVKLRENRFLAKCVRKGSLIALTWTRISRVHSGERPFLCSMCKNGFAHRSTVIMSGSPICGISYVCKDNHLLNWCIDIHCSHTLCTDELEEMKLAGV
jgi:hypothetical protein